MAHKEITHIRAFCDLFHEDYLINVSLTPDYRIVHCVHFQNCRVMGNQFAYPTALLLTNSMVISPYDDDPTSTYPSGFYMQVLSCLKDLQSFETMTIQSPVFFFIYDFTSDNSFLFDAIPLLSVFFELKRSNIPDLKLLVPETLYMSNFALTLLNTIFKDCDDADIIYNSPNNVYSDVYVSTSLTNGPQAPHASLYEFYSQTTLKILSNANDATPRYLDAFELPLSSEITSKTRAPLDKVNLFYFASKITVASADDANKYLPYLLFCKPSTQLIFLDPDAFDALSKSQLKYCYAHLSTATLANPTIATVISSTA